MIPQKPKSSPRVVKYAENHVLHIHYIDLVALSNIYYRDVCARHEHYDAMRCWHGAPQPAGLSSVVFRIYIYALHVRSYSLRPRTHRHQPNRAERGGFT